MPELILTRGIPGSGKTSWALGWVAEKPTERLRVNRDDLRRMLHGVSYGLTWAQEQAITETQRSIVRDALTRGLDVVVDDTNLRAKFVRDWQKLAPVTFKDFEVGLPEAWDRDLVRQHPVGREVLIKFWDRYTKNGKLPAPPEPDETPPPGRPYVPDIYQDQAVIFDIDGTLAHIPEGGRSPYDGSRVHEDILDVAVCRVLIEMSEGHQIIIMSGRDEEFRDVTERWLTDNRVPFDHLYMRSAGDRRKDSVVKLELFDTFVRDRWHVVGVFDDRDQVVRMWRGIGLKCFQVQEGAF